MSAIVSIKGLTKVYGEGKFHALKGIDLEVQEGEVLALLGPNGAGKTTLISITCGIVTPTGGTVQVGGHDVVKAFRAARSLVGLVPQEIALEPFEKVLDTVRFTRGLFGKPRDDAYLEELLKKLNLWDKRDAKTAMLSGGMKRRLLIAKALSHKPRVLFLDEPTAGVDVELRRGMWEVVEGLRAQGTTIILTTHYLEEAEAIADRIAVVNKGQLLLVEDKATLMQRMGQKQIRIHLSAPVAALPAALEGQALDLAEDGASLTHSYSVTDGDPQIVALLDAITAAGLSVRDLETRQSTLEEIFVDLVRETTA